MNTEIGWFQQYGPWLLALVSFIVCWRSVVWHDIQKKDFREGIPVADPLVRAVREKLRIETEKEVEKWIGHLNAIIGLPLLFGAASALQCSQPAPYALTVLFGTVAIREPRFNFVCDGQREKT